ncbi:hypothetical protein L195_g064522, partial [Trifolium pratense]
MFNHEETERAKVLHLNAFKECWMDSTLLKSLDAQRIETKRLTQEAERIAQEAIVMHQDDVIMLDY